MYVLQVGTFHRVSFLFFIGTHTETMRVVYKIGKAVLVVIIKDNTVRMEGKFIAQLRTSSVVIGTRKIIENFDNDIIISKTSTRPSDLE